MSEQYPRRYNEYQQGEPLDAPILPSPPVSPRFWGSLLSWIVCSFLALCLVIALILALTNIFGPLFNQTNYNLFNDSPQHLNAVAQTFTTDCQQIGTAQLNTGHQSQKIVNSAIRALENDISYNAATVHVEKVDMPDSVRTCVNTALQDVQHPTAP